MALELRQIEGGRRAGRHLRLGAMEDVEAEVEQRAGHFLAVDGDVPLGQVPAARAHHQHRRIALEGVGLSARRVGEVDLAGPAVLEIGLALDHVGEHRRGGVLEVGHEDLRARVQRIDDHLAVDRAGDLDPAVEKVGRDRGDLPVAVADRFRLGEKIGQLAGVEQSSWRSVRRASSSSRRRLNRRCSPARNASASALRISACRPPGLALISTPAAAECAVMRSLRKGGAI